MELHDAVVVPGDASRRVGPLAAGHGGDIRVLDLPRLGNQLMVRATRNPML